MKIYVMMKAGTGRLKSLYCVPEYGKRKMGRRHGAVHFKKIMIASDRDRWRLLVAQSSKRTIGTKSQYLTLNKASMTFTSSTYLDALVADGEAEDSRASRSILLDPHDSARVNLEVGADVRTADEVVRTKLLDSLQLAVRQLYDGAPHEVGRVVGVGWVRQGGVGGVQRRQRRQAR